MPTKVAVCQVPEIREDIKSSLEWIEKFTRQAQDDGVSLICFPECFLQGYLAEKSLAERFAINLNSIDFGTIRTRLSDYQPMIVFGMIEKYREHLFNSAVIIQKGELIGKYRKTHLLDGERIFTAGTEYPVFEINDLKFGINICYDTQFPEAGAALSKQGVKLILCPSNNLMQYQTAEKYKHLHHEKRIERVLENQVWLFSSDIIGERDGRISYGPTSSINPLGEIVAQVPLLQTGMVTVEI